MFMTDAKTGVEIRLAESGRSIGKIIILEKKYGGLQIGIDVPKTVKITRTQERDHGAKR